MITPIFPKSSEITSFEKNDNSVLFFSERGKTRIMIYAEDIIRVSYTEDETFSDKQGQEINDPESGIKFEVTECDDVFSVKTNKLNCIIIRYTGSVSLRKLNGKMLFSEAENDSHFLEKFDLYKTVGNINVEETVTADGVKKRITSADKEYDRSLYHTKLNILFQNDEKIYGLGQAEEGCWDLRNTTQYLHQANKKIAIPFYISSLGYGVMFSTQSPAIFSDTQYGSYFYTEADYYLDYFLIAPEKKEQIIAGMRKLTGKALIPPKWAFGYVQSQERYESEQEILDTADEFINRNIPVSCIVLDWLSWEDGMWGQKTFDKKRFPNPLNMVNKLHENDIHFMISIWPSMDEKCDNYKEMKEKDCLLTGINICNAFDEKARKLYWEQANRGLATKGIESWWCDSSEPITPEWSHLNQLPPSNMYSEFVANATDVMPLEKANAYGYYHAMGMYEGQKADYPDRRMLILTRNGYLGSQKLGVTLWSGDTSATWDVLKNQAVAAVQFSLSGIPYWTFDIGAFFVKKGVNWFWNGDYDDTVNNPGYKELYTRWLQLGTFLPMFRAHGTDCRREPWAFEDEDNRFYNIICDFINLRYRLLPYIYSTAGNVWKEDKMFIKPLFMTFDDPETENISTQFMFGSSMMVCPVLNPMYYDKSGKTINCKETINVYLPAGCDWYDWWTNEYITGGQWIEANADLSKIPVFVKAGSIIPVSKDISLKDKYKEIELLHFPDKNGNCENFILYNDKGEGYDYLNGDYTESELK